jgi:hypothetical protein
MADSMPGGSKIGDGKPGGGKARKKRRKWPVPLATAVIGAAAVIVAAVIARQAGGIDIIAGAVPSTQATVTITPRTIPQQTVTVTAAPAPTIPGPISLPDCPVSQGCKAFNLVAQPASSNGFSNGMDLSTGEVRLNGSGDLYYSRSDNGTLELTRDDATAFSPDVTAAQASRQGCQALTASDPDSNPITALHKGLTICVATDDTEIGIALVTETRPVGRNGVLYLRALFWPSQTS